MIGPITGEAKIFAGTVISDNCPDKATITGVQNIVAEIGIAIASASQLHLTRGDNQLLNRGDKIRIPPVARAESAKPGSIA